MAQSESEIGTLASEINDKKLYKNQNVVKVLTKESLSISKFSEAKNFMRTLDKNNENIYHHLGIYCYRIETLRNFVSLKQTQNEINNRLEQLRALDNNIKIKVSLAKESPKGVDTEEDFMAIKKIMEYKTK